MYNLPFINKSDFEKHVLETLECYSENLLPIDLNRFNTNVIDPIKLLFDKNIYNKSYEEIIKLEIQRQRDKSNNNAIGYFHQNIFKYINKCTIPNKGFDIFFDYKDNIRIAVEMKNKHNTMNSSASQKVYMQMQNYILKNPNHFCFLVEVIAPCSRDVPWSCCVNGTHCECKQIRRVSIDKFYSIVTGINNAFYLLCNQLPITIEKLVKENKLTKRKKDSVLYELNEMNPDLLQALYLLAFKTYDGFDFMLHK